MSNPNVTRQPITMKVQREIKAVQISWKPTNEVLKTLIYNQMVAEGMVPHHDENTAGLKIEGDHVVITVETPTEELEAKPIRSPSVALAAA